MDACDLPLVALMSDAALDSRGQGHGTKLCEQLLLLLLLGADYPQKYRAFCPVNALSGTPNTASWNDGH